MEIKEKSQLQVLESNNSDYTFSEYTNSSISISDTLPPKFSTKMPNSTALSNGNGSWILDLTSLVEGNDSQVLTFSTVPNITEIVIRG